MAVILASCHVSQTYQDSVEVSDPDGVDARIERAKEITTTLWSSGLRDRIHEKFPDLNDQQIAGLGLKWSIITSKSLTDLSQEAKTTVSVQCLFTHGGDLDEVAAAVVKACKKEVEEAIQRRPTSPAV
jgi:hypothetical protein